MIKLTYQSISTQETVMTLRKLGQTNGMPVKTAYTIGKLISKVDQMLPKIADGYREILKKHCLLDEHGQIQMQKQKLPGKDGKELEIPIPGSFIVKTGEEEAFRKAMDAYMATEASFEYSKIPLKDIEAAGLSPIELDTIDPILHAMEVVA